MSEINRDQKYTLIELTTDSGLNFSSNNPRIKHTGTGTFTIQSTQGKINITSGSTADDSLNLDSAGGLDIDAAQEISIETSDTTDGIKIAETLNVPIDIGAGGGTFLMGKSGETAQFRGSLTIAGDLTVNGDTVSTNVIVNETEDPMLRLNEGAIGSNAVDIGFVGDRGDDANIGFFWDESADEFVCTFLTNDDQLELTGTTQNTGISDYADFHAGTGEFDDTLYAAGQKFSVAGVTGNTLVNQGTFAVTSTTNQANAIRLNTNAGTNETIIIENTQGTSVMTNGNNNAALQLVSTVGGIGLRSTANLAGSIQIEADGGTTETIVIKADQGTSVTSINLISDVGGITMTTNNNAAITIENDSTVGINTSNPNNIYALDVNGTTNTTGVYQNNYLLVPPGCIMPYAAANAPGGWLVCDGTSVSRTTYAALFAVIGATYGFADGASFNLPNLQGRTIFGLNSGDGDFNSVGAIGGSKTRALTTTELPSHSHTGTTNSDGSHSHTISDTGHTHTVGGTLMTNGSGTCAEQDYTDREPNVQETVTTLSSVSTTGISINSGGSHTHTFTTGHTGIGNSFSIMNPYMALNYIIKV
jgi:microcystin-dependent protein